MKSTLAFAVDRSSAACAQRRLQSFTEDSLQSLTYLAPGPWWAPPLHTLSLSPPGSPLWLGLHRWRSTPAYSERTRWWRRRTGGRGRLQERAWKDETLFCRYLLHRRTLLIARFVMQIPAEPVSVFQLPALPGATLSAGPRDPINSPLDRESPDPAFKRLPSNSLPSIGKTLRILQRSFPSSSSPYSSFLGYPNCVMRS